MKGENLRSVIQPDFAERLLTGEYAVHHVFPGRNRKLCEKYGFLVAIRPALHDEIHENPGGPADMHFRKLCYDFWMEHIGDEESFFREFF